MIDYESDNWIGILARTRGTVLPRLMGRMAIAGVVGIGAFALERVTEFSLPPVAHGLIGVALGLLLVFRTNASYDRFWEGRKLVGQLVRATRDLMRQIVAHVEDRDGRRDELRRLILAFYGLAVQRLREEDDLSALSEWLTEAERERLGGVSHRAPVVAAWLSTRLASVAQTDGSLTELELARMDANVSAMLEGLTGCERIRFTPVPFAYAHHIKVFLSVFCFTSPFAMVSGMGLFTPIAAVILTLALFGIDEIGVEIEDPFGDDPNDLPLDAIGAALAGVTDEMLRTEQP
ncbi:MAG: bestrophin [Sandaracinaceae bacterium]|nr:bestrophin [Sandaracinaceae bacterium]